MRPVHTIVVHHTATSPDWSWETVQRFHVEVRGWDDGGYHFLVERGGRVRLGRHPEIPGAHVKGRNEDTIGVCIAGNFAEGPVPPEQWEAAVSLVADLLRWYGLGVEDVKGHRELAPPGYTLCPGFEPERFREALRAELARRQKLFQGPPPQP